MNAILYPIAKNEKERNSRTLYMGQNCDGWHLLKTSLSIIQEMMPPNTKEALHYHHKAQQFFFVLSGEETFEAEEKTIEVKSK